MSRSLVEPPPPYHAPERDFKKPPDDEGADKPFSRQETPETKK
jgi:hypothetical protein